MEIRRKRVQISGQLIAEWLRAEREATFAHIKARGGSVECIQDKLPDDAEIVSVRLLPNAVELTFRSNSFEAVNEGAEAPLMTPTFQTTFPEGVS